MNKAILACVMLAWGTAASGQDATSPPGTTHIGPGNDPNQVVCRRELRLGSRLDTQRVCRTRAEWAEHRRQYQQNLDRAQRERPSNMQ
jgi:hypothetical protein